MDERFAKMIKEKLGEGAGVAYWEAIFKKSIPELLIWFRDWWEELGKDLEHLADHHERNAHISLRRLGFDIIEGHLKGMLLILEEIRSRVMAMDAVQVVLPIELPAPAGSQLPDGVITEMSSCHGAPIIHSGGGVLISICSKCKQSAFSPVIG